ncbi:MAG: PspA/IM30 family protein [Deltaproteobacteria bacterium]|nr:PspA/IM30 family protein [Deltaproteobacteria bacterium]
MSLFDRIGLLVRSNLNALVSNAEDPEKILNQLLIDMRDQFIEAKKQVAVAIADEKRLYAKMAAAQQASGEWERKAMLAVQAGDDQLAQEALSRQQSEAQLAEQWKGQWMAQKQASEQLRAALQQLNVKIEEAKRKKDLMIARAKRAEAQKTIQNTMAGLNDNSAFDAFGRMSEKVEQMEAEAAASGELAADISGASLEDRFKKLESQKGPSDALLALKAKMGLIPASAAAPGAASIKAPPALTEDEFSIPDIGIEVGNKAKA